MPPPNRDETVVGWKRPVPCPEEDRCLSLSRPSPMVGRLPLRARPCAPSPPCSSRSWPCSSPCCRSPLPRMPRARREPPSATSTRPSSSAAPDAPQAEAPAPQEAAQEEAAPEEAAPKPKPKPKKPKAPPKPPGPAAAQLRGAGHELLQLPQPGQGRAAGDPQPGAARRSTAPGAAGVPASARPCRSNGTIRIATWSFDDWDVAHALVAARKRGVSVQVVAAKTAQLGRTLPGAGCASASARSCTDRATR